MKRAGGFLERNRERLVCAAFATALVAYLGLAVAGLSRTGPMPDPDRQRHEPRAMPSLPDAGGVFAGAPDDYWDDSLRRVWVEPKPATERAITAVPTPLPSIPAPAMLLPEPGPDVARTAGLPRWPSLPEGETTLAEIASVVQEPDAPTWDNLMAGSNYRVWGRLMVLPKHIDDLRGLEAIGLADSAAFIEAADRGEVVEVLEVRPLATGIPWYRIRHRNTAGWVNGMTLRGLRIERR